MLSHISDLFDSHSYLIELFSDLRTLTILLGSLAVLGSKVALEIAKLLKKVFIHRKLLPNEKLEENCKQIWPEINCKIGSQNNLTRYLIGLAAYLE